MEISMYLFHAALALSLLSLTAGMALYIWGLRNIGNGSGLAKLFGFLIVITAIMSTVCASYCGFKEWQLGGCPVSHMMKLNDAPNKAIDTTTAVPAPVETKKTP
jgi:hypothetical protein